MLSLCSCEEEKAGAVLEVQDMSVDQGMVADMSVETEDAELTQEVDLGGLDIGLPDMMPELMPDLGPDTGINPEFVMNQIELLSPEEGFDLDGDGTPIMDLHFYSRMQSLVKCWAVIQMSTLHVQ